MRENLENSAVAAGLVKISFSFEIQRMTMQKKYSKYHTTVLISHANSLEENLGTT